MELYHGAHTEYTLHLGQDYTDDEYAAGWYAQDGEVAIIELDTAGLVIVEADDGYNPNTHGDGGYAADIVMYWDSTDSGRELRAYRLMTEAALAAVTVIEVIPSE